MKVCSRQVKPPLNSTRNAAGSRVATMPAPGESMAIHFVCRPTRKAVTQCMQNAVQISTWHETGTLVCANSHAKGMSSGAMIQGNYIQVR